MRSNRITWRSLGVTLVAALAGAALNSVPVENIAWLWPGRVLTLPVAMFLGPVLGALAGLVGALPAYASSPSLIAILMVEGLVLGLFERWQRPMQGRALGAAFMSASLLLVPSAFGLPSLTLTTAPLALQRLLVLTVAPVLSDFLAALITALDWGPARTRGHRRSLRGLVFHAFALVATLPLLVVTTLSGEVFTANRLGQERGRLIELGTSLADRINTYVDMHRSGVSTLAAAMEQAPEPGAQHALLVRYATIYPDLRAIAVANDEGLVRDIVPERLKTRLLSISGRDFFVDAIRTRRSAISDVAPSPATGEPIVLMGAPVFDAKGEVAAVAHASLSLTTFRTFVDSYVTSPEGLVTILDRSNRVIVASDALGYRAGEDLTRSALVERADATPMGDVYEYQRNADSVESTHLATRSIVNSTGWTVYVQEPNLAVAVRVPTYYAITVVLMLLALGGSVVGARLFANTVTSPIEQLVQRVRDLSLDGPVEPIPVPLHAPTELATLVGDVNVMHARLGDAHAKLQQSLAERDVLNRDLQRLAGELEDKVVRRTAQLASTTVVLQNLIEALPGALLAADANGTIRLCNDTASALLNRPVSELTGMPLADLFDTPLDVPPADGAVVRQERNLVTPAGTRIPVLLSATTLEATGAPSDYRTICVAIDVRDRKKLEMELHQAQKLESVGRLAAGVAHEINTPTQFVSDSVHFLKDAMDEISKMVGPYRALHRAVVGGAPALDEAAAVTQAEERGDIDYLLENVPSAIDRSIDGLGRVTTIVRSMKEFAHPDQKEASAIDLNRAIESTLVIASNECKYVADVETSLADLPRVTCYAGDVNQAVLNVVVNAAHAIGDAVAGTERRGRISVRTRRDGDWAVIEIEDTGNGVPEAIRHRIFDPFFTTKEVGKGTGQGLAITRAVVIEKHGGDITFESTLGVGTTFTIRLPIHGAAGPQAVAA